jgi:hypothetical protein
MRAEGRPILIRDGASAPLKRLHLGGSETDRKEKWLQELIHQHPDCIPMDQIEPGLSRLVPIRMEVGIPAGYIDNLLMTPDGDIVIVETKLWKNPEARREVVAQALDYASSLFRMDYDALEKAVLKSYIDQADQPKSLFKLFDDVDTLEESAFVDAVNSNLQNGRIVVVVIGDGIRTGVETLASGLQSHAGFHFTFALVELAVFEVSGTDEVVVVPRTLAQTCMIERGIVRIDDQRSEVVAAPEKVRVGMSAPRQSITSEQFLEAMRERHVELPAKLESFIEKLTNLGVYPDFQRSLNLKWDPPAGKTVNLGYIKRDGQLWTDAAGWFLQDPKLAKSYIEDLAVAFDGAVSYLGKTTNPYVSVNSHAPRVETIMAKFDGWYDAIERFISNVHDQAEENIDSV